MGQVLFFDTLSITLGVYGLPFSGLVCLEECRNNAVDCSSESAGQSVYGPRTSFLEHFGPFRCKTDGSITSSHLARSLQYAHLWWLFRRMLFLHIT